MMRQVAKSPGYLKHESRIFSGPVCYAESDDGVHWRKPAPGQVVFKGGSVNNALALPHTVTFGATRGQPR